MWAPQDKTSRFLNTSENWFKIESVSRSLPFSCQKFRNEKKNSKHSSHGFNFKQQKKTFENCFYTDDYQTTLDSLENNTNCFNCAKMPRNCPQFKGINGLWTVYDNFVRCAMIISFLLHTWVGRLNFSGIFQKLTNFPY